MGAYCSQGGAYAGCSSRACAVRRGGARVRRVAGVAVEQLLEKVEVGLGSQTQAEEAGEKLTIHGHAR